MSPPDPQAGPVSGERPRFSLVTAVHNVRRYLAEFIDSIEAQAFDLSRVEIIAVDDGSTDDSLVLLKDWAARRPELVTVLSQDNAGQGAARNLAIERVRGEWVSFPDPDDILRPDYLAEVDAFLGKHPDTMMVGTNRLLFFEQTGQIHDRHPMKAMYQPGNQMVDIDRFPEYSQNSAATGFFRPELIRRAGIRFDPRIRPVFEDGHFCISYLLACEKRLVGFVSTANYVYRKRADNSSTLQNSVADADRYLAVPRYGYLDVLRRGSVDGGYPPEWLQNMVLYDISYYFSADIAVAGATGAVGEVGTEFIGLLREMTELLDPLVIDCYKVRQFDRLWKDILLHSLSGQPWRTDYGVTQKHDPDKQMVRIAYRFVGEPPAETVLHRGVPVRPQHAKIRDHVYFGTVLMRERIMWVPLSGTLRVLLDGRPLKIQPGWEPAYNTVVRPRQVEKWFAGIEDRPLPPRRTAGDRFAQALALTPPMRDRFHDAWVVMDRIHDADDNGERLFRYLRDHRPDINAWFVLKEGTPDWQRLERDGYRDRMVPHGTVLWKVLMLHCRHLVSSHADGAVTHPPDIMRLREPDWKSTFLQHGVIKDDLSRWLNPKHFDLFVTSTPQEQASIVADGTPYAYTSREARMTGLPRFDRLLALGAEVPREQRRYLLVCPTWRHWLNVPPETGSQRREVTDTFFTSEYVQLWTGFLSDDRLRALAEEKGLRIGFLPHPNIQPALRRLSLPGHVEALTFAGNDVQRLIAQSALMVTDYSSMAFNAAYLDRPVVYFQFDADLFEQGAHVGRPGYFRYGRDGFGPVTATVEETVRAVVQIIDDGGAPAPEYQQRIDATFTERDGRCCERTTAAIESMRGPWPKRSLAWQAVHALRASPRVRRAVYSPRLAPVVHSRYYARVRHSAMVRRVLK